MERVRDEHAAELNEFKHIVAQQQREVAAVAQTKQQQLQQVGFSNIFLCYFYLKTLNFSLLRLSGSFGAEWSVDASSVGGGGRVPAAARKNPGARAGFLVQTKKNTKNQSS
jgi:hypothetical protein